MVERPLLTIAARAADEFTEKKSRFIGQIAPAEDEDAATAFLEQIRAEHRGAAHHCYAWICGKSDEFQRSSDAGEPAGTAGRPILEAIKRAELHNTVIVVTRYFGGILLGAGGLTRAYGKAAQIAIAAARQVLRVPAAKFALTFDYTQMGRVESFLQQQGYVIESRLFTEQVCFLCLIEDARVAEAEQALADLSGGTLRWQDLGEQVMLDKPV